MRLSCYDPATNQLCGGPYPASLSHANFPAATDLFQRNASATVGEDAGTWLYLVMNDANVDNTSLEDSRVRCWDTQTWDSGRTMITFNPETEAGVAWHWPRRRF